MSRALIELLLEAQALQAKSAQASRTRSIAAQTWQLEETQFEDALQDPNASNEVIESARLRLITMYERFIDSCLAFRAIDNAALVRIEQIQQEIKKS